MVEDLAISIALLDPCVRFSMRLRSVAGFQFDTPLNRCVLAAGRTTARLGPDEWLILGAEAEREQVEQQLNAVLGGTASALVDISHRNVGIAVAGRFAREVINGGCPLDLDDEVFPAGSATRTLLGKAEIVLLRPDAQRFYRIECGRSFGPYVLAFLQDVAREFDRV